MRTEHTCYLSPGDLAVKSRLCYIYSAINAAQHHPVAPDKSYSLDLLFCPSELVASAEVTDPILPTGTKNHHAVLFLFNINLNLMVDKNSIQSDFIEADYEKIKKKLDVINDIFSFRN